MSLSECHAVCLWHARHRSPPLEQRSWDLVLMLWIAGWAGAPAALLLDIAWAQAAAAGALFLPGAYVGWRRRLHRAGRLRCDWIGAVHGRR